MAKFIYVNTTDKTGYLNVDDIRFIEQPEEPGHSLETNIILRNGETLRLNENYQELLRDLEIEIPSDEIDEHKELQIKRLVKKLIEFLSEK